MQQEPRDVSISNRELVPLVRQSVFFRAVSAALALVVVMLCLGERSQTAWEAPPPWVLTVSYWLDPLLLQGLSVLAVGLVVMGYRRPSLTIRNILWRRKLQCFTACVCVGLSLVLSYVLGEVWLKPAFGYQRPTSFHGDSFILEWLGIMTLQGCPSGFMVRQIWLFLLVVVFAGASCSTHPARGDLRWTRRSKLVMLVLIACTVLIACVRLARRAHTVFDLAMGIATGVYLFWLVYYLRAALWRKVGRQSCTDMVGISCVFLPVFLIYSKTGMLWTVSAVIIFALLGVGHWLPPHMDGESSPARSRQPEH